MTKSLEKTRFELGRAACEGLCCQFKDMKGGGIALKKMDMVRNKRGNRRRVTAAMFRKFKNDKPVHISELGLSKRHLRLLNKAYGMEGQGFMKTLKKGGKSMSKFVRGKMKIKPSQIVRAGKSISDIGALVAPEFAPEFAAASSALGVAGKVTDKLEGGALVNPGAMRGKGLMLAGQGMKKCPAGCPASCGCKGSGCGSMRGSGKPRKYGSRDAVWEDMAQMTRGGLTKSMLMRNKRGRIVSKARHERGKLLAASRR